MLSSFQKTAADLLSRVGGAVESPEIRTMAVELRPLGVRCNIRCRYCYQNPQRDAGDRARAYDLEAMKAAIAREGGPFSLFGGEPLLLPEEDLEELWAWGLREYGGNSVQTNGVLINDRHIRMFQRYGVKVGISVDGPGELNDVRWVGSLERTRQATAKSHAAIARLCEEGIPPGLIVTLHRRNATRDRLPAMHAWIRELEAMGVTGVRLHLLEVEEEWVRREYALSERENVAAMPSFAELERELTTLRFDVFADLRKMLLGKDWDTGCVWNACDPYTTRAVRGVEGRGERSNCGRTNKDGIDFTKADREGFERYLALYHTPQEHGGCRGCRFFLQCKGQCPGTAIDGDWRNRTEHCGVWKALYRHFEERLIAAGKEPLSLRPDREAVEGAFLAAWARGRTTTMAHALARLAYERSRSGERKAVGTRTRSGLGDRLAVAREPRGGEGASRHLLDFRLPDFHRVSWVSGVAREVWGPRLEGIRRAWAEIEWRSVAAGARPCAAAMVSPESFVARAGRWAERGLSALPLEVRKVSDPSYGNPAVTAEPGEPLRFRVVVGEVRRVAAFQQAWETSDQAAIGRLLGYPPCCHEFFRRVWVDRGWDDTTWPMAVASAGAPAADGAEEARCLEVEGPPETNVLWRFLGVRAVPHLPCRCDCGATVELGRELVELGRKAGFSAEMDRLLEVLSWPAEWSALHGIAEIKTPVLKVARPTDATVRKLVVRRRGRSLPAEAARGLAFPYRVRRGEAKRRHPAAQLVTS